MEMFYKVQNLLLKQLSCVTTYLVDFLVHGSMPGWRLASSLLYHIIVAYCRPKTCIATIMVRHGPSVKGLVSLDGMSDLGTSQVRTVPETREGKTALKTY